MAGHLLDGDGGGSEPPAYRRVKEHVLGHILAGDWRVGERIPSEHDLKDQFGVSRMTVHRALRELTDEGYLSRAVGAGTFVCDRSAAAWTIHFRDIPDEARSHGHRCRTRLVSASHGSASAETAVRLGLRAGAPVLCSTVVRWVENAPAQLEERWVNAVLAPDYLDADLEREQPAAVLARLVPGITHSHEVRAVAPKGRTRTLLAVGAGEPCLLVTTTSRAGNAVVSVADCTYPGSRYALPGRFL